MLWPTIACSAFTGFCAASQDVVIDGWRIDVAPKEKQGVMLAYYQFGYRLGLLCAGAGALYLADFFNWRSAYFAMMALMMVGMAAAVFAPDSRAEVDEAAKAARRLLR